MKLAEAHTIAPPRRLRYFKWLKYLGIVLAIVYLWLTAKSYLAAGWTFTTILHAVTGLIWLGITYSYFKMPIFDAKITLSSKGISFDENGQQRNLEWESLQDIKMTNNAIFITPKNGRQKELNISYLEYKEVFIGACSRYTPCGDRDIGCVIYPNIPFARALRSLRVGYVKDMRRA